MKATGFVLGAVVTLVLVLGIFSNTQRSSPSNAIPLARFTPVPSSLAAGTSSPTTMATERTYTNLPAGSLAFSGIGLSEALTYYAVVADAKLEVDPRVLSIPGWITFSNREELTHSEAVRQFEEALHRQAGLVFEHYNARNVGISLETNSVAK